MNGLRVFYFVKRVWKGRRTPLLLISGLFVAFLWWVGPKLPYPLNNVVIRGILTAIILGGVAAFMRWRSRRDQKDTEELMEAVAEPDDSEILKTKFKGAIKTLKAAQGKGRRGLLELPWYIIIGPPGSGKTTLLRNAGLTFPLDGDEAAMAVRGVGGTRDCDWWFANEAVLLDTAGRYTTQDSDESADRKGWLAFLDLLKGRRRKRPINGILIAIGADTLLSSSRDELQSHAETIRKRVLELYTRLNGRFPIYLMVTKTDLVAGFNEFFENLSASEREQVWGYTQQVIKTDGETANVEAIFDGEFELLLQRLSGRVLERLKSETDPDRRALIVGFPEQLARAREQLRLLVAQGFMPNNYQEPLLLRGLYLTSGTQEGTPIDRMMGGMARALGTDAARLRPANAMGRSYFIKDLLSKVAFPEQDLLGLGFREAQRRRRFQLGAYAAIAGLAGMALVVWTYAYLQEREYVASAEDRLLAYTQSVPPYPEDDYEFDRQAREVVQRLDALKSAREDIALSDPNSPLVGLPGDTALLESVDRAYNEQLRKSLGPLVTSSLRQRIRNRDGLVQEVRAWNVFEVNLLSTFVRAYASMQNPRERLDTPEARQDFIDTVLFDLELRNSTLRAQLQDHIAAWVNQPRGIGSLRLDADTLDGAKAILTAGSDALGPVRSAYDDWLFEQLRDTLTPGSTAPGIVDQVGTDAEDVFVRRSGGDLNAPIPFVFTKAGFERFLSTDRNAIIARVKRDDWVYGEGSLDGSAALLSAARDELTNAYVADYIDFWRDFLEDVTIQQVNRDSVLRKMSRPPSPLKGLLRIVVANTSLGREEQAAPSPSGVNILGVRIRNPARTPRAEISSTLPPRDRVTETFRDLARLFGADDQQGEIDAIIGHVRTLANVAADTGEGALGDVAGARSALDTVARDMETAGLPIDSVFREIVGSAEAGQTQGIATRLAQKYRQDILPQCRAKVRGRFPFNSSESREVGLRDLAEVFGPDGSMTRFIEDDLGNFIDRSRGGWTWREDVRGITGDASSIRQFQKADRIRRALFTGGEVKATFDATVVRMGDNVAEVELRSGDVGLKERGISGRTVRGYTWPDSNFFLTRDLKAGVTQQFMPGGSWVVFRMLDSAQVEPLPGGRNFILTMGDDADAVAFRIETDSVDNPFTTFRNWRTFYCPSELW